MTELEYLTEEDSAYISNDELEVCFLGLGSLFWKIFLYLSLDFGGTVLKARYPKRAKIIRYFLDIDLFDVRYFWTSRY